MYTLKTLQLHEQDLLISDLNYKIISLSYINSIDDTVLIHCVLRYLN